MFIPTARETRILEFFRKENTPHSVEEISNALSDEKTMPAALEGCVAKGFLEKDANEKYFLTDAGKSAI